MDPYPKVFMSFWAFCRLNLEREKYNCFSVLGMFRYVGGKVQFVLNTNINTSVRACFCHLYRFVFINSWCHYITIGCTELILSKEIRNSVYGKGIA